MAKKKRTEVQVPPGAPPGPSAGTGPDDSDDRGKNFVVRLERYPVLLDALERYLECTRPAPSKQSVMVTALEDFLIKAGFYQTN